MPDTPHIQFGDNAQVHGPVVGGNVNTLHYNATPPSHSPQELQNRHRMLARVRAIWISGELAHSLYATARIELGLKDASDVVANPWRLVLEQPQSPTHSLPPGTSLTQIYDGTGGSLLILGAPGAGKTTLLLDLARDLLDRADGDVLQLMPVVFHLSSWAEQQLPLTEWLTTELHAKYQVPPKVGQAWVSGDQLLLLLDGLDEVAPPYRAACVQAINSYRQDHGLVPLIVCSRETEYQTLAATLAVDTAIRVQPLTAQQIDAYLASGGPALAAVQAALHKDPDLQDLLDTPLMLNVLALAYGEMPIGTDIPTTRQHIFAAFLHRMLTRRQVTARYSPQGTQQWLSWLAQQLVTHGETVFYIEQMQPNWLPSSLQGGFKRLNGIVFGLAFGLAFGLTGGVATGLILEQIFDLPFGINMGVLIGLGFGGIFGMFCTLVGQLPTIKPVEVVGWSWQNVRLPRSEWVAWLRLGQLFSAGTGLLVGVGLSGDLGTRITVGLVFALLVGSALGLLFGVLLWLNAGFSAKLLADQKRIRPNEGIWHSLYNGVRRGLVGGILAGLLGSLVGGWGVGLVSGLVGGILGGLLGGWVAGIQHSLLRVLLWRTGATPINYVDFLNYATERILLRRVGGGYIFIHRLLLEHCAELDSASLSSNHSTD